MYLKVKSSCGGITLNLSQPENQANSYHYRKCAHSLPSLILNLWSLGDASTLWYSRASCLVAALYVLPSLRWSGSQVPPSGTLPPTGRDFLVVMCIGGGVNARSDSFSDFHSLKKSEYKGSYIGNDYQTVGYLGKEVYNTTAYSFTYDLACSWGLKVVSSDIQKFYVTISCHDLD